MAFTSPVVIDAPEPRGLRYGLITAANGPLELPQHAESGGLTFNPVSCGRAHTYSVDCDHDEKSFDEQPDAVVGSPFLAYGSLMCGTAGTTPGEMAASASRNLINGEQTQAEAALAALLAAGATPLAAADPSLVGVVGELEQWLYGTTGAQYGNVGYLHAPARFAAYAMESSLIVQDGAKLTTRMGSVWVFGGGYPDDDTVYISGQVTVWRSTDVFVPDTSRAIDLAANQRYALAERPYVVTYECAAASATVAWEPAS